MFKLLTKQSQKKRKRKKRNKIKNELGKWRKPFWAEGYNSGNSFGCGPFSGHLKFFSCLSVQKKEERGENGRKDLQNI